jgi:hypothetical protein
MAIANVARTSQQSACGLYLQPAGRQPQRCTTTSLRTERSPCSVRHAPPATTYLRECRHRHLCLPGGSAMPDRVNMLRRRQCRRSHHPHESFRQQPLAVPDAVLKQELAETRPIAWQSRRDRSYRQRYRAHPPPAPRSTCREGRTAPVADRPAPVCASPIRFIQIREISTEVPLE